jgi:hypothetical protein
VIYVKKNFVKNVPIGCKNGVKIKVGRQGIVVPIADGVELEKEQT